MSGVHTLPPLHRLSIGTRSSEPKQACVRSSSASPFDALRDDEVRSILQWVLSPEHLLADRAGNPCAAVCQQFNRIGKVSCVEHANAFMRECPTYGLPIMNRIRAALQGGPLPILGVSDFLEAALTPQCQQLVLALHELTGGSFCVALALKGGSSSSPGWSPMDKLIIDAVSAAAAAVPQVPSAVPLGYSVRLSFPSHNKSSTAHGRYQVQTRQILHLTVYGTTEVGATAADVHGVFLKNYSALRYLEFRGKCTIRATDIASLARFPHLADLRFSGNVSVTAEEEGTADAGGALDVVMTNPALRRLDTRGIDITDDTASNLAHAVLAKQHIVEFNAVPIKKLRGNTLAHLGLASQNIGTAGAIVLADLINHGAAALTRIDLRANRIGAAGMQALETAIGDNPSSIVILY